MQLTIKIIGLEENRRFLEKIAALDLTRWFQQEATPIIRNRITDIFYKGVDREAWSPLHPFTKENKSGGKVMVASQKLLKSVTEKTADSIYEVSKTSIEIGSKLPYARIHNEGGKIRVTPKMRAYLHWRGLHLKQATEAIKIPKRQFLFVSPAMEQALKGSLIGFIQAFIKKEQS